MTLQTAQPVEDLIIPPMVTQVSEHGDNSTKIDCVRPKRTAVSSTSNHIYVEDGENPTSCEVGQQKSQFMENVSTYLNRTGYRKRHFSDMNKCVSHSSSSKISKV